MDEPPVHVFPITESGGTTHEIDGETCWCLPVIERHPRVLVIHRSREQILDS